MPRLFVRVSLAACCALTVVAYAQEGLRLRSEPLLSLQPPAGKETVPVFIEAERLRGHAERETEAEGHVRLRRRGQTVFADWLRHDAQADEVTAAGNVRIQRGGDLVEGTRLRYNLGTDRGFMDSPRYTFTATPRPALPAAADRTGSAVPPYAPGTYPGHADGMPPASTSAPRSPLATATPVATRPRFTDGDARGRAERILFEGPSQYRAQHGEYTTCEPGNDDWYIRSAQLHIDKDRDVGTARDASIVFMGHTILYSPYLSFSLHQQRKSGFLTPHYGSSSKSGTELTVPYYWNIAPNYDATFYPRLMTKRGLQLATDVRYLERDFRGNARVELLPGDQQRNEGRYAFFVRHAHQLPGGWTGSLNLNRVSDDQYFTDLSTVIALTSQTILPQEGTLARGGTWGGGGTYGFSAHFQHWQTLQTDPLVPVSAPYDRRPQLTLTAQHQNVLKGDFDFLGNFVAFEHPSLVNGRRLMAYPSLSLPVQTSYAHVIPKIGFHATHYALDRTTTTLPDATRTLPVVTVDTGLVFERSAVLAGHSLVQTLEPRLYYVYIPYRDQSRLPNFESGVQDINLATIFSENQFSGHDRINDANQVTYGVVSRLVSSDSGIEHLRGALAQRYYFQAQRVTVPGVPPRLGQSSSSDLLAALSGTVAPNWVADVGWQYNTDQSQTQKFNVGVRYRPQPGKVLNLVYRDTLNSVRQTDISTQWPLTAQWTGLARWNYSIRDNRTLEALAGFEYNGGCWALRIVGHRFATATQQASTSVFIQLELNGVSRLGSNPMETLRNNIGGFVQPEPRSIWSEEYRVPYR
jgi:LPS-assembly protein